ncbi:hypothetical protein C3L33_01775, partial [Rhododendron williamsianum]
MMRGAALVAIAAAIGNLLQGWDNATIAGSVLYIKREFKLQTEPTIEGLIVAMSLIGATVITTFSGPVSDSVGRRPMLIISSVLYFLSGLVMLWSPNVYVLLIARLLDGFGIGLAVTLVPVYISETAPPEIRGLLNTLPQFTGCVGMFLSYCMVFGMSLTDSPSWRLMLGVLSIPSIVYFGLTVFYLPESPRWLVSKGRMVEAKRVKCSAGRSMFNMGDQGNNKKENEDVESLRGGTDGSGVDSDDNLRSPLLSRQDTDVENPASNAIEQVSGMDIGGGWQLAYKVSEGKGEDGNRKGGGGLKRIYLHQENTTGSRRGSVLSLVGGDVQVESECVHASALVSQSALPSKDLISQFSGEIEKVKPSAIAKGPGLADLFDPGVKHALVVGVGIQILQQFSGINGVLYYTPQILEQAGVGVLLSNLGLRPDSASFLISGVTTLLMLPSIGVAMRLMDVAGRRFLKLRECRLKSSPSSLQWVQSKNRLQNFVLTLATQLELKAIFLKVGWSERVGENWLVAKSMRNAASYKTLDYRSWLSSTDM